MGARFTIKVLNADKVAKFLNAKTEDVAKAISSGIAKGALLLEGETKESISGHRAEPRSVDTGRFLNSVTSKIIDANSAHVFTDLDYPVHLEYGTSTIPPRWHFRNTKDRNTKAVKDIINEEVKQAVKA